MYWLQHSCKTCAADGKDKQEHIQKITAQLRAAQQSTAQHSTQQPSPA